MYALILAFQSQIQMALPFFLRISGLPKWWLIDYCNSNSTAWGLDQVSASTPQRLQIFTFVDLANIYNSALICWNICDWMACSGTLPPLLQCENFDANNNYSQTVLSGPCKYLDLQLHYRASDAILRTTKIPAPSNPSQRLHKGRLTQRATMPHKPLQAADAINKLAPLKCPASSSINHPPHSPKNWPQGSDGLGFGNILLIMLPFFCFLKLPLKTKAGDAIPKNLDKT